MVLGYNEVASHGVDYNKVTSHGVNYNKVTSHGVDYNKVTSPSAMEWTIIRWRPMVLVIMDFPVVWVILMGHHLEWVMTRWRLLG